MKVGIIGAGAVGSACVTALVSRACARDIVVVNRDRKKARGLVTDVQYGAVLSPAVELRDGDYADLQGASLVMITAGANEKTGGATDRNDPAGRLRLLDTNVDVYKDIVPRLHAAAPQTLVLVVTDPSIRWPMQCACWGMSGSSAPGHISTACGSDFTWLAASASARPLSMP
jgi:L-lactate dehydrogenase